MIRLIISDIDGTLVPEGGLTLNPEYLEVVRKLTEKGITFVAASGRQMASEDKLFGSVRDHIFYISESGALVFKHGEVIESKVLDPKYGVGVLEDLRKMPEIKVMLSYEEGYYMEGNDEEFYNLIFHTYAGVGGVVDSFLDRLDDCVKISLFVEEHAKEYEQELQKHWGDKLSVNMSGAKWIDITRKDATKGDAIAWLQNYLGVTTEETMAFGDNFNDMTMLQNAGESYASVLSHDEVKQAAKYTVASYKEDGVLQVLKTLL